MNNRRLGRSGLKVSEICLGAWINFGDRIEDEATFAVLDAAVEEGINFFDTADVYAGAAVGVAGSRRVPGQGARPKKGVEGEAQATGRNPTDRGKCDTKRHLLTDGAGVPLAVVLSAANRHDMKKLGELLEASLIEQEPEDTPDAEIEKHLCLDRGYDYKTCREQAQQHGYTTHIPPKATPEEPLPAPDDPQRHPPRRWVVEVSHAWFNRFRRLLIRWDKLASNYLGFVQLAASLIIYRKISHPRALSG